MNNNWFGLEFCDLGADFDNRRKEAMDRLDRLASERAAAKILADAAKARAWRVLRHARMTRMDD